MNDDDPLGGGQLLAVMSDLGFDRAVGRNLRRGHHGIEALGVEIVEGDLVPAVLQGRDDGFGERVIEAAGLRMPEDNEDLHARDPSHSSAPAWCQPPFFVVEQALWKKISSRSLMMPTVGVYPACPLNGRRGVLLILVDIRLRSGGKVATKSL
jgi:hypothetical protein